MNILLREITLGDFCMLKAWMDQPYVTQVYGDSGPWLEELYGGEYDFIRCFVAELDGKPVGFGQYYDCNLGGEAWYEAPEPDVLYSMGLFVGESDRLNQGIGSALCLALMTDIADNTNCQTVLMQAKTPAAAALLKRCGFVEHNAVYSKQIRE